MQKKNSDDRARSSRFYSISTYCAYSHVRKVRITVGSARYTREPRRRRDVICRYPDEQGDHVARHRREFEREMSERTEARLTKDASCMTRTGKPQERGGALTPATNMFATGLATLSVRRRRRSRRISTRSGKRIRTGERERATLLARTAGDRWPCYGSPWRVPERRSCVNTNRPNIHPRIFNVPPFVRAISTISRRRKQEVQDTHM